MSRAQARVGARSRPKHSVLSVAKKLSMMALSKGLARRLIDPQALDFCSSAWKSLLAYWQPRSEWWRRPRSKRVTTSCHMPGLQNQSRGEIRPRGPAEDLA